MKISLIAAIDQKSGLGKDNQLLCYLPADLKYFKRTTLNKPIIMGYNTFKSIGKALQHRQNIVLTSKKGLVVKDVEFVNSWQEAKSLCNGADEIMIIGGASIYQQLLEEVTTLYITRIGHTFDADVFFPSTLEKDWHLASSESHLADQKNSYDYTFQIFEKIV